MWGYPIFKSNKTISVCLTRQIINVTVTKYNKEYIIHASYVQQREFVISIKHMLHEVSSKEQLVKMCFL